VVLGTALCVLVAIYVVSLTRSPQTAARSTSLTLQTVGALGPHYDHPTWVSYLVKDRDGKWLHSTSFDVPANSLIRVTIEQYDTATGLRNPYFGRPQGTVGNVIEVDGKTVDVIDPALVSHTFAIPQLGVFVPLPGVADNAKDQCSAAPCTSAQAHRTITFTFRTGKKGRYRWQCFVPCAAGFVTGFGGPMQRFGYMDGYLNVV
jgi:hypothetical protein